MGGALQIYAAPRRQKRSSLQLQVLKSKSGKEGRVYTLRTDPRLDDGDIQGLLAQFYVFLVYIDRGCVVVVHFPSLPFKKRKGRSFERARMEIASMRGAI